jgi:hypothetical protein
MSSGSRGLLFVAAAAVMAMATPSKADIIVGQPADSGNCIPFGCGTSVWGTDYQQIYAASQFSGAITITNLEFFNTRFENSGPPDIGTFTISLSTTSAAVEGLDSTLTNNIGSDNIVVFDGSLPSPSGGVMSLVLSTPFTYEPTQGNLLMNVSSTDAAQSVSFFFDVNSLQGAVGVFSRAISPGGVGEVLNNQGLVTGFSTGAVPEPSTWAMMLAGFAGLGFLGYRQTAKARVAA